MNQPPEYFSIVEENFSTTSVERYLLAYCVNILLREVGIRIRMQDVESISVIINIDEYGAHYNFRLREVLKYDFPYILKTRLQYLVGQIMLRRYFK